MKTHIKTLYTLTSLVFSLTAIAGSPGPQKSLIALKCVDTETHTSVDIEILNPMEASGEAVIDGSGIAFDRFQFKQNTGFEKYTVKDDESPRNAGYIEYVVGEENGAFYGTLLTNLVDGPQAFQEEKVVHAGGSAVVKGSFMSRAGDQLSTEHQLILSCIGTYVTSGK